MAKVLEERYGKHGVAFLVDEGVTGILEYYGASVALFGMAEKGSVNVKVKVESLGGHSSVPPRHTGSESHTACVCSCLTSADVGNL